MAADKTNKVLQRFREGVASMKRAKNAIACSEFDLYEQALRATACSATGALEWTLKAHLRHHARRSRMAKEDEDRLRQPTFEVLVRLMKTYGDPPLDDETADRYFEYRDIRNMAEHDAAIPSMRALQDILRSTRIAIVSLLRVEDSDLPIIETARDERLSTLDSNSLHFLKTPRAVAGRHDELSRITDTLRDAVATRTGRIVIVRGASGTGKTFLAQEACRSASQMGFDIAVTACEPFHEGMSLFPIQELVRQLSQSMNLLTAVEEHFPASSSQVAIARLTEEHGVDPVQRRDAFLATFANALYGRFSQRSERPARPILLLLDDLEWLESGTADALLCVRARFSEGPVVVMGSYRTDLVPRTTAEHHPLNSVVNIAKRNRDQAEIVDLSGIEKGAFSLAVESILEGPCHLPPSFLDRLYQETEGNPLFTREVLHMLSGGGRPAMESPLRRVNGTWTLAHDVSQWNIPATIEEAITARLGYLNAAQQAELEKAAVIGRQFAYSLIREVATATEDVLSEYLERLIDLDVILELGDEDQSFGFTHGKIRDVIYESIPRFKRLKLHGAIADALKLLSENRVWRHWEPLLGNHLYEATQYAEACHYLLRAARLSTKAFAVTQAVAQYERALDSGYRAGFPEGEKENDVKIEYVQALRLSGLYGKALDVLRQVLLDEERSMTRGIALNQMGDLLWLTGRMDQALERYRECEGTARSGNHCELLLEVTADLCEFHDREAERMAASNPGIAAKHRLDADRHLDEQISLAASVGNSGSLIRAKRNEAKRHRRVGRLAEAIRCYEDALSLCDSKVADHNVLISYAKTLRFVDRVPDAWAVVERVYDWGIQTGTRRTEAIARQYKGLLLMEAESPGDLTVAELEVRTALAIHEEIGYDRGIRESSLLLGELHMLRREWADGRKCLERSIGISSSDLVGVVRAAASQLEEMAEPKRAARLFELSQSEELLSWCNGG